MGFNRRNKGNVGLVVLFVILAVMMFGLSGVLMVKGNEKSAELKEIKEQVVVLDAASSNLTEQQDGLKTKSDQLSKQIEELQKDVEKLKETGINVSIEDESASSKAAYLTFDDGPSGNTVKILDFLKANNIKATFFVLEKNGQDEIYKRIVDEGHTIALHSTDHDYSRIYSSVDSSVKDFDDLNKFIKDVTGQESKIIRFPGGSNNTISNRYGGSGLMDRIRPAVGEKGYIYFDWNVDSMDASKGVQDKNVIVDAVLNQSKYLSDAVILMHDAAAKTTTVDALPEIVEGLKQQGFVFRALTEESPVVKFK
ncbi:MAG: polysaccharide deacetylase family protein [Cellulosilyticaceae bacterium]